MESFAVTPGTQASEIYASDEQLQVCLENSRKVIAHLAEEHDSLANSYISQLEREKLLMKSLLRREQQIERLKRTNANLQQRYKNLASSKLASAQVKYWKLRTQLKEKFKKRK
ncbi:hypothetical protein [uncultured Brevibacterium sp.]|uniref:hypothetical protein n=1 Tax=uncultured Brevibacterium sp. TaxID=189678 RepID=UPI0025FD7142|nr:hypothetical protein [uncultured Brevibacterium sp.]